MDIGSFYVLWTVVFLCARRDACSILAIFCRSGEREVERSLGLHLVQTPREEGEVRASGPRLGWGDAIRLARGHLQYMRYDIASPIALIITNSASILLPQYLA